MSDKLELLSCPFCGGDTKLLSIKASWVQCVACGAASDNYKSPAAAVAAWNRRATPTAETGWQDMESAPRDDFFRALLYCPSRREPDSPWNFVVGTWEPELPPEGEYEGIPASWRSGEGFELKPSHWRPLPPPPQEVD